MEPRELTEAEARLEIFFQQAEVAVPTVNPEEQVALVQEEEDLPGLQLVMEAVMGQMVHQEEQDRDPQQEHMVHRLESFTQVAEAAEVDTMLSLVVAVPVEAVEVETRTLPEELKMLETVLLIPVEGEAVLEQGLRIPALPANLVQADLASS